MFFKIINFQSSFDVLLSKAKDLYNRKLWPELLSLYWDYLSTKKLVKPKLTLELDDTMISEMRERLLSREQQRIDVPFLISMVKDIIGKGADYYVSQKDLIKEYNIGIVAGTFRPFHLGHKTAALAAIIEAKLDGIVLFQSGDMFHQPFFPDAQYRMELLKKTLVSESEQAMLQPSLLRVQIQKALSSVNMGGKTNEEESRLIDIVAFIWLCELNPHVQFTYVTDVDRINRYGLINTSYVKTGKGGDYQQPVRGKNEKELVEGVFAQYGWKFLYYEEGDEKLLVNEHEPADSWLRKLMDSGKLNMQKGSLISANLRARDLRELLLKETLVAEDRLALTGFVPDGVIDLMHKARPLNIAEMINYSYKDDFKKEQLIIDSEKLKADLLEIADGRRIAKTLGVLTNGDVPLSVATFINERKTIWDKLTTEEFIQRWDTLQTEFSKLLDIMDWERLNLLKDLPVNQASMQLLTLRTQIIVLFRGYVNTALSTMTEESSIKRSEMLQMMYRTNKLFIEEQILWKQALNRIDQANQPTVTAKDNPSIVNKTIDSIMELIINSINIEQQRLMNQGYTLNTDSSIQRENRLELGRVLRELCEKIIKTLNSDNKFIESWAKKAIEFARISKENPFIAVRNDDVAVVGLADIINFKSKEGGGQLMWRAQAGLHPNLSIADGLSISYVYKPQLLKQTIHSHPTHEVTCMLDGNTSFNVGNGDKPVSEGMIIRVPKGAQHSLSNISEYFSPDFTIKNPITPLVKEKGSLSNSGIDVTLEPPTFKQIMSWGEVLTYKDYCFADQKTEYPARLAVGASGRLLFEKTAENQIIPQTKGQMEFELSILKINPNSETDWLDTPVLYGIENAIILTMPFPSQQQTQWNPEPSSEQRKLLAGALQVRQAETVAERSFVGGDALAIKGSIYPQYKIINNSSFGMWALVVKAK